MNFAQEIGLRIRTGNDATRVCHDEHLLLEYRHTGAIDLSRLTFGALTQVERKKREATDSVTLGKYFAKKLKAVGAVVEYCNTLNRQERRALDVLMNRYYRRLGPKYQNGIIAEVYKRLYGEG